MLLDSCCDTSTVTFNSTLQTYYLIERRQKLTTVGNKSELQLRYVYAVFVSFKSPFDVMSSRTITSMSFVKDFQVLKLLQPCLPFFSQEQQHPRLH